MKNVGTLDRILRLIAGLALVALPFLSGWPLWANPFALWASILVGAVLAATAIFRFCPIYAVLGLRTCPLD